MNPSRGSWRALIILCLGALLILLNTTIVVVALPSIEADLEFSGSSLAWVMNAYMLTYGGFLLLVGRLGDLYGHRRLFLIGIVVFTLTSAACAAATSQDFMIMARAVQGIAGAVVTAVTLSLIMELFTEPTERAKAMAVFGFVSAGGDSLGVILGGLLTSNLSWRWIFLINLPLGAAVIALSWKFLPDLHHRSSRQRLDVAGAIIVTAALMLAVYAIVNATDVGWHSYRTLSQLAIALCMLMIFLVLETRVSAPLVPLRLFRRRNLAVANLVGVLWAAAIFSWFFLATLYLQLVLGYGPLQVGLSFLPGSLVMAALLLGVSARLVMRFGIRWPLVTGLLLMAMGLLLFARVPVHGRFVTDVLPAVLLLGLGAGVAVTPILLAAMSDVVADESGLASGMVNTSFMIGGALGLAILAGFAAAHTQGLQASGVELRAALNGGYQSSFLIGALFAALGACGAVLVRTRSAQTSDMPSIRSRSRTEGA